MSPRLLIFTDLDGTLLDHYSYSFEPAASVLRRLREQRVPVIPATSKTSAELLPLRRQLELETPFIVENGAALFIPEAFVPAGCDLSAADLFCRDGFLVKEFVEPRQRWIDLLDQLPGSLQEQFTTFTRLGVAGVAELTGLDNDSAALACQRQYGEPINWTGDERQKRQFIVEVARNGGEALAGGRFIHVSGGCSKAEAMNWFADCYRNKGEEVVTVAVGDSENDREMLELASLAVVIPSPVHPTLELMRSSGVRVAGSQGPRGWAIEIERILEAQQHGAMDNLITGKTV